MWIYNKSLCPNGLSPVLLPQHVRRELGSNTIGMLAWNVCLHTPEYPEGRHVVIIANDVTHQAGSPALTFSHNLYDMGVMRDKSYFNRVTLRLCKKLHFFQEM